jgi:hypothetical protein
MQTVFLIVVPLGIIGMAVESYRLGVFFAFYALARNLLAFLAAMTLCEPLTQMFLGFFPKLDLHPGPLYWRLIFFALAFGVVFGVMRWLKIKFTPPRVEALNIVEKTAAPALGLINGYVLTGFLLVLWSMMPFAKFIPNDLGRVDPDRLLIDSGGGMLKFYNFVTRPLGGSRVFLLECEPVPKQIDTNNDGKPDRQNDRDGDGLWDPGEQYEDLNKNGRWDTGWLWRYRHFADITEEDLNLARSTVIVEVER